MRIVVPVVIEMTDQQFEAYAQEWGLVYAKDVRESVRGFVLTRVQQAMETTGSGATVSLKGVPSDD